MGTETRNAGHAEMWGAGPFEEIAETIADMHDDLVATLGARPGEDWLDVGCGTGAVAERAAAGGANVTGVDLAAPLVEIAARRAQDRGLSIEYGVGDAEALLFADASFDVVSSSVGAIFAPDHSATAAELARVVKPGGRLGITAWRSDGRVGDFFRALAAFRPPPPPGATSPLAWGDDAYAAELLGGAFDLSFEPRESVWDASPEESWEQFSRSFGPVVVLVRTLPEERVEELRQAFVEVMGSDGPGSLYTLILGTRR